MKVRTLAAVGTAPKITVPAADGTHFYTGGRMLSFFPQINQNGMTYFKEDVEPMVETLRSSLADIQHIKPGYGVPDPYGITNGTIGSVADFLLHDDGIDIICKNEREVVKSLGFDEADFKPGSGKFSNFSQETDYSTSNSPWIVVDKDHPEKILATVDYKQGMELGFKRSHYSPKTGVWNYYKVNPETLQPASNGHPVYVRIRPTAFSGVGHVMEPADPTGIISSYAASIENGEKMLADMYPGVEAVTGYPGSWDQTSDFDNHPDLFSDTTNLDIAGMMKDDEKYPDDHYAAVWHENTANGPQKNRALRIKDNKGNYDRNKLVPAYHALSGMRGPTHVTGKMPTMVHGHAMALVRHGLQQTKPKISQETQKSKSMLTEIEVADLQARFNDAAAERDTHAANLEKAVAQVTELKASFDEFKAAQTALVEEKDKALAAIQEELAAKKTELEEVAAKELASTRLAELEAIHPFTAEEKTEEFVKSLSSISDDRMEVLIVRRELAKAKDDATPASRARALASVQTKETALSPAPRFEGMAKGLSIQSCADII